MSWNGHIVVDMDAHIRERADRFFLDYIDPGYRAPYQLLCEAVARQEQKGDRYALFGSRTAIVEQLETGRALGVRDTFGLSGRSEMEHGRVAFPPGRKDPLKVKAFIERARAAAPEPHLGPDELPYDWADEF